MNTETVTLPHGYTATVCQDEIPSNPFEAFDCEPPIACFDDGRLYHPAGKDSDPVTLADLFDMIPESRFRTAKGRAAIADAAGIDLDDVEAPEPGNKTPEAWRWAMREALPEAPCGWRSATAYFECMEAVAGLLKIPCYFGTSQGYCQGDSVLVFVAATPEWRKKVGAPLETCADQCKGTFDLYSAWAWGDVYGVSEILRPNGEEMPDGSCWGFYGTDHEKSGLLEHCRGYVEADRENLARESAARFEAACRDVATV